LSDNDEKMNEEDIASKIIFSTFHQIKGMERKVVLVFNFDESYFEYYGKEKDRDKLPNELYVAITRASECLTVFKHYSNKPFRFIDMNCIKANCYTVIIENSAAYDKPVEKGEKNCYSVTELLRHQPEEKITEWYNMLDIVNLNTDKIMSNKFCDHVDTEQVSEINGTAIPLIFEGKIKNNDHSIFEHLIKYEDNMSILTKKDQTRIHRLYSRKGSINRNDQFYLTTCLLAVKSCYIHKTRQISFFKWFSKNDLDICMKRLENLKIKNTSLFEGIICLYVSGVNITGAYDCLDTENNVMYEFKFVKSLTKSHYLQLAIYMYIDMMNDTYRENRRYILFNIYTNEKFEIRSSIKDLETIVLEMIDIKKRIISSISDNEFFSNSMNIYRRYFK